MTRTRKAQQPTAPTKTASDIQVTITHAGTVFLDGGRVANDGDKVTVPASLAAVLIEKGLAK